LIPWGHQPDGWSLQQSHEMGRWAAFDSWFLIFVKNQNCINPIIVRSSVHDKHGTVLYVQIEC
jgi:hypothetical protein